MSKTYDMRTHNNNEFKVHEDEFGRLTVRRVEPESPQEVLKMGHRRDHVGTFADREILMEHFKYTLNDPITYMMVETEPKVSAAGGSR